MLSNTTQYWPVRQYESNVVTANSTVLVHAFDRALSQIR